MSNPLDSLHRVLGPVAAVENNRIILKEPASLASTRMDDLARLAVFGDAEEKEWARWAIHELGQMVGVRPASIHELYMARGRGEVAGFTVPAMNIRGMSYDTARAMFRAAIKLNAGAFLIEIARSEIAYTEQRPAEYVAVMTAAALREGYRHPIFIQGDHFQVNAKKYAIDPVAEVAAVKALASEAIPAGFYNIDVDTSTLVDLSKPNLEEQQRLNYEVGVEIGLHVRSLEPAGVTISIGGEIGEVGTANSTVPELRAYMEGYNRTMLKRSPGTVGLSKISVQSGTSHGGVVLADGRIADVKLDFQTLEDLSRVSRTEFGLAGAVQHGASTLPDNLFNNFPRTETAEIHLATNFQTMLFDHLPDALREEIYAWLREAAKDERKPGDTDEQFFYKSRKKALGPFKKALWSLPSSTQAELARAYDAKFEFLFTQLGISGTAPYIERYIDAPDERRLAPSHAGPAVEAAPDDAEAGE